MRIVHLSYAQIKTFDDPVAWLEKINFYTGVIEQMAMDVRVKSIHCISYEGVLKRNGVEYEFLNVGYWQTLFPFKIHSAVTDFNPDVVIVHGLIFPWQVLLLKWQLNRHTKVIEQHHAERPLRLWRKMVHSFVDPFIDCYLFCSSDLGRQWVVKGLIKDSKKIREVMEASSGFYQVDKTNARLITKVEGDPVFLWVGGLHRRKNPMLAVRAFIRLLKLHPSAKMYVIYQSSELLDEVKSAIADGGASNSIILVGFVPHSALLNWYNSADFIVSTSYYEGSGLAVCEAMSCGCIPVLTRIPSFEMMTDHARCGILFAAGDEEGLLQTLIKCIQLNLETEKHKVLDQFNKNLSFEAIARKTIAVMKDLEISSPPVIDP